MLLGVMRKRRLYLVLMMTVGLSVLLLGLISFPWGEPRCQGRSLSAWIVRYGYALDQPEAEDAIRQIGSNAIPHLLSWMQYRVPDRKKTLMQKADHFLPNGIFFDWARVDRGSIRFICAAHAFEMLGPDAKVAIPGLTEIMNDGRADLNAIYASYAIAHMGPEGVAPLVTALTNENNRIRRFVLRGMRYLKADARSALPLIIEHLQDKDTALAMAAAQTLGELGLEPALVVPALRACLDDSRQPVKNWAVRALEKFGPDAGLAAPDLRNLLKDPNWSTRDFATNALRKIAPEALQSHD